MGRISRLKAQAAFRSQVMRLHDRLIQKPRFKIAGEDGLFNESGLIEGL